MKKILVTGAAGFIGSHLGNALTKLGYDVLGVDDYSNASLNTLDFECLETDCQYGNVSAFDAVFHLAASINVDESISHPTEYFINNALGTQSLIDDLRHTSAKTKFIYASSAEVYGSARQPLMSEDHPLDPLSPYAASKLAAEQFCKVYSQLYDLDITVIRNFNTFGEYQRDGLYGGVIAKFAGLANEGKPLPVYGSGEQSRDYMHVSQAVSGYILALENKLPGIINFGSGSTVKIIDIANFIAKFFGVAVEHVKPRPNEIMRLEADITRAKRYGYVVQTNFWEHLEKYLQFIKDAKEV